MSTYCLPVDKCSSVWRDLPPWGGSPPRYHAAALLDLFSPSSPLAANKIKKTTCEAIQIRLFLMLQHGGVIASVSSHLTKVDPPHI